MYRTVTQEKTRKTAATLETTIENALTTSTHARIHVVSPRIGSAMVSQTANVEKMKLIVM